MVIWIPGAKVALCCRHPVYFADEYGYGVCRGLKSVPSLSTRKKEERLHDTKIGVIYPPSVINAEEVPSIIQQLATERVALHRTRLWWSIIGMPIVAPFALVPV